MRRPILIGLAGLLVAGAVVGIVVGLRSGGSANLASRPCSQSASASSAPDFPVGIVEGRTVAEAASGLAHYCGALTVTWAPSSHAQRTVLAIAPSFIWNAYPHFTIHVTASSGRLKSRWMRLPGASAPPIHKECAVGLGIDGDGNAGPLTCGPLEVNVGAWDYFSKGSKVMRLTRSATKSQVLAALCPIETNPITNSQYLLARTYYGWRFSPSLFFDTYVVGDPISCQGR